MRVRMNGRDVVRLQTTNAGCSIGTASGWCILSLTGEQGGGWQWSAYGPNGGTMGHAPTEEEAKARAQKAAEALRRPRMTQD